MVRRWLSALAILTLSIGILAPGAGRDINVYDEGVAVYGAERITNGDVPYRDFWTIYAPGDLYLLAGLFELCGTRLIVERHAWVLLEGLLALLVYVIARRTSTPAWAGLCWIVTVLWTRQLPFFGAPGIPALVCGLAALLAMLVYLESSQRRLPLAAGALVALCALFRQDSGGYACLSLIATLVFVRRVDAIGRLLATVAIVLTPVAIALLIAVPLDRLFELLVTFPLHVYPRMRALPLPTLSASLPGAAGLGVYLREQARAVQLYGSIAVLATTIIWSLRARNPAAFLIGTNGLLLVEQARIRSDLWHLYPAFLFALMAGAILVSRLSGWRYASITAATTLAALLLAALSVRSEWLASSRQTPLTIARAAGLSTLDAVHADAYQHAIAEVQRRVPPGQAIFVGNTRHDRLGVNDVMFYFLAERPSATAYHDMHPGVVTTSVVQEEMMRSIDAQHVSCIVLRDDRQPAEAGNDSGTSSGVTILDQFLRSRFVPGPRFDDYQVWTR